MPCSLCQMWSLLNKFHSSFKINYGYSIVIWLQMFLCEHNMVNSSSKISAFTSFPILIPVTRLTKFYEYCEDVFWTIVNNFTNNFELTNVITYLLDKSLFNFQPQNMSKTSICTCLHSSQSFADESDLWWASPLSLRLRRFSLKECLMRLPRLENVYGDRFDAPAVTKKKFM